MNRHLFGKKDSPHIAITCLNKLLQERINNSEEIMKSFYMDDLS